MVTKYWKHQVIDIGSVIPVANPNNNYGARFAVAGSGVHDKLVRSRLHGHFAVGVHEDSGGQMPEGWQLNPLCVVALWCDKAGGVVPTSSTINPTSHPNPTPGWLMVSKPSPVYSPLVYPNITPSYICPLPRDGVNSQAVRTSELTNGTRTSQVYVVWSASTGLAPDYNVGFGGSLFAALGGKFYVSTCWEAP